MFLICTEQGINVSFVAKNKSIEVISIPPCASTKNDCASGSPQPLVSPPFKAKIKGLSTVRCTKSLLSICGTAIGKIGGVGRATTGGINLISGMMLGISIGISGMAISGISII